MLVAHRLLERRERHVRSVQQSRHTAVTRVYALTKNFNVARRQLKLRHELSKIRYYSVGLGDDRLDVAHHRLVGQQATDIALTLLHVLHDNRQRFCRTTGIVENWENLLAGLINQRTDALGRIPLGHCLNHRVVPIELRALPAADIDKSCTCDAVPAADRPIAPVTSDSTARR